MSRIDISIIDKESGKLIANRGFCRSSHLSSFCENAQDSKVREWADSLFIGINITEDNIKNFLHILEYTLSYLKEMSPTERSKNYPFYKEELYNQFLEDLDSSLTYLKKIYQQQDLEKLKIEIV